MVAKKPVKTLRELCLKAIPTLVTTHIRKMASKSSALQWYSILDGDMEVNRDHLLQAQVKLSQKCINEQIIWYDYEDVFKALLKGVEEAITKTRKLWNPAGDMAQYRQEMEATSSFTDLVLLPMLRRLDFRYIPKSLRSRVVDRFETYSELRELILGTGQGGQWLFKGMIPGLIRGLKVMTKLERFTCKHDCTVELVAILSETCAKTLKVLDVENSKGVTNKAAPYIMLMSNVEELNLFNTPMDDESKARILISLPNLTNLVRGDFLCEALGWIDYLEEVDAPQFLLTDFFPSQSYYFHEEWQMEMVGRMCPYMATMYFIFHESCVPDYLVLATFEYLTELDLYGGSFYKDKVKDLLSLRGFHLKRLNLIAMSQVDYGALAHISQTCPDLIRLGLNNCDLGHYRPVSDPNSDEEYERRQRFVIMAKEAHEAMRDLVHIEEIALQSPCRAIYFTFLLSRCAHVRRVHLGRNSDVGDEAMLKVYVQHGWTHLEEFHCEKSDHLTVNTLQLLTHQCGQIRAISDIQAWSAVLPTQVGQFRESSFRQNWDLDTSSHQKLRKYLEMRDFERKAYVNRIAGPTMERIRRAQQDRWQRQHQPHEI
ncbi:uncharacterized protein LOC131887417 [Tigriopus californicus]|uniref:uncharacterized protein LOC131887417 n=1 Tax=Tigriopus californicus TaxID=6832 RepID=UPI0027DAB459|nr:uncharacterized protein LOC131887417 [Tigriopus californicus]